MTRPSAVALPSIGGEAPMVVHLAAEYYPYARTGGLAEAAWGLHRDQHRSGLATMAIVPLYRAARAHLRHLDPVGDPFTLQLGPTPETFRLWRERDPASETPTCFIEHDGFFGRNGLYGEGGADYPDNYRRFAAFAAASVAALPRLTSGPVLLHAHDWHAALAPVYVRTWFRGNPWYDRIPLVLSVHNGGYQGHFPPEVMPDIGLPWSIWTPEKMEWYGKTNYLKGGLTHVDMATTVSPTHAEELRTPAGGFGLHDVYEWMGHRFTGVLNGIDQSVWDPQTDGQIAARFSANAMEGKRACKTTLQRRFGLPENPFIPLIGFIGRMATQKGLDIIVHNTALFHFAAQYVFLGSGDRRLEESVHALHAALPSRIGVETTFADPLEHEVIAGADLYLMPSQYEPCGLTQMRAQRYGTIPVARRVGGLADTIDDGVTGFLFEAFDERAVVGGVWRAMTEHRSASAWREMQREAMSRDFGWDRVAERYIDIYVRAIALAAGRGG
ncbi:MAG TPA: glycogen/starch synthase [Gemmatimonadales bacterium]